VSIETSPSVELGVIVEYVWLVIVVGVGVVVVVVD